jgi:hypothetical protein
MGKSQLAHPTIRRRQPFEPNRKSNPDAHRLGVLLQSRFFAVGIVGYCRLVMLVGLGLFAFQESNRHAIASEKVAQYAKTKVAQ